MTKPKAKRLAVEKLGGIGGWPKRDTVPMMSKKTVKPLRFAYADPPYLGCGVKVSLGEGLGPL